MSETMRGLWALMIANQIQCSGAVSHRDLDHPSCTATVFEPVQGFNTLSRILRWSTHFRGSSRLTDVRACFPITAPVRCINLDLKVSTRFLAPSDLEASHLGALKYQSAHGRWADCVQDQVTTASPPSYHLHAISGILLLRSVCARMNLRRCQAGGRQAE